MGARHLWSGWGNLITVPEDFWVTAVVLSQLEFNEIVQQTPGEMGSMRRDNGTLGEAMNLACISQPSAVACPN